MALQHDREVEQGLQEQGPNESIRYSIDVSNWGEAPTNPTLVVSDESGEDVTEDVTDGSAPTASGDSVILPFINSLTLGEVYEAVVRFSVAGKGQPFECFFRILCK